jgi:hypothetical protein
MREGLLICSAERNRVSPRAVPNARLPHGGGQPHVLPGQGNRLAAGTAHVSTERACNGILLRAVMQNADCCACDEAA